MTIYQHHPRTGDAVHVEGEAKPNGFIFRIDWQDKEIIVKLHGNGIRVFSFDDFYGNRVGNKWMLEAPYFEHEPVAELRQDVHILFDLTDEKNVARLLFLTKYFNYVDRRYKDASEQRRMKAIKLSSKHGVDWDEMGRLLALYHSGTRSRARRNGA